MIANNTIAANSAGGVYCDASSALTIANNTITGNSNYGIYLRMRDMMEWAPSVRPLRRSGCEARR